MKNIPTDTLAKILWEYNSLHHSLTKADCILVLGSNDLRVAQYGADLFLQGYAPLLIFSGNRGSLTKHSEKTEAETFAEEAIKRGVPQEKILIENKSTNTGENILFTKKLLIDHKITVNKLIVVQKPYMQRRAYATIKKLWRGKNVIITAPNISFDDYPNDLLPKNLIINILVGDTQRIKEYPKKGFQIKQPMPHIVWKSYQELISRGFTNHLIREI